ncbi:MAG: ATP-binding protein [Polyangiaceae bacterium]|nr:ATP-binding protein [Polyangiaceae bacterium]
MPVIKLQVPGELSYRELATRTVALACKLATTHAGDLDTERGTQFSHELVSAVGEAFNNTAIHSYNGLEPGDVTINISFDRERVQVEVCDTGHSFDLAKVKVPDLGALPESGMGLYIIRSFVDHLDYEGGTPNVLKMTKYLAEQPPRVA